LLLAAEMPVARFHENERPGMLDFLLLAIRLVF
jgi:hypothetical protein